MHEPDTVISLDISQNFQSGIFLKAAFSMTRYSNFHSQRRLTSPNALTELISPVESQYRELLDLRERVKMAEATAKRLLGERVKLKTSVRPAPRMVSRKPNTRQPEEFTKPQLYAMLAEAVRNTH